MTPELSLIAICAVGLGVPMLLAAVAQRMRRQPVRVQVRPVHSSTER